MESFPKPSASVLVCAVVVIAVCLVVVSVSLAAFGQMWDPCSIIGGILLLPVPLALAISQYLAVFRRKANSATAATVLLFGIGGLAGFMFVTTTAEMVVEGIDLPWGSLLLAVVAVGTGSALAGWVNLRWRGRMKASASDCSGEPGVKRPFQFSLRELLGGTAVLAAVLGLATYFTQSTPPRYAEHVDRSKAPFNIPDGATDISFCQGFRGAIAYEFTIDEQGFRDWINSGIGSLESQAANVRIQPIQGAHMIDRYYLYTSELSGHDQATVTQGFYYSWSKEDRGVYAVFDSAAKRAYYWAHYN